MGRDRKERGICGGREVGVYFRRGGELRVNLAFRVKKEEGKGEGGVAKVSPT